MQCAKSIKAPSVKLRFDYVSLVKPFAPVSLFSVRRLVMCIEVFACEQ